MNGLPYWKDDKVVPIKGNPRAFPTESRERLAAELHLRTPVEIGGRHGHTRNDTLMLFGVEDVTAGVENELQAVVKGSRGDVDLPLFIAQSNYYANLVRRFAAGETSRQSIDGLESYLDSNKKGVWENSWVRLPLRVLSPYAGEVFKGDLSARKSAPHEGLRSDAEQFHFTGDNGEPYMRIPVSYLLKLSLADVIGVGIGKGRMPPEIRRTAERLLDHFSNDNTSPETFSFHTVSAKNGRGPGSSIAGETSIRYLLTQLLTTYANYKFELLETGQEAMVYFAPHPPLAQHRLNESIADGFYRELFMSPCLSGWDEGQPKHEYMKLCHQVLSRSRLNALGKLRDAGIVHRNLVVLPNMSNISLANNGTHLSLGSRKLTALLQSRSPRFTDAHEKYLGDLAIKLIEHFLPLFPGTYSASPYRIAFEDFHPENVLGFLPHELDFTHLRMIWRRWKKKARVKIFGQSVTPFGPLGLDGILGRLPGFKGDFVPDYRLIDYFASLMSTEKSPALDGTLGNDERLKKDLAAMGVFDERMATYRLYRLREHRRMGFSGFEGRHYSVFHSIGEDLGNAADLQALVTSWAYNSILQGKWTHTHIPDTTFVESERRQIFFGKAIGIPTFFVHARTGNAFLLDIIKRCKKVRMSRRYPGYLRVYHGDYARALVGILKEEGAPLIEAFHMEETLRDLENRLENPDRLSTCASLVGDALKDTRFSSPMKMRARDFNETMEEYYRETLRKKHMAEAFHVLKADCEALHRSAFGGCGQWRESLARHLGELNLLDYVRRVEKDTLNDTLPLAQLEKLIGLVLLVIHGNMDEARKSEKESRENEHEPPVCGATVG